MKKLTWFVMVLCLSAFAIGCGGDDKPASTGTGGTTGTGDTGTGGTGTEDAGN